MEEIEKNLKNLNIKDESKTIKEELQYNDTLNDLNIIDINEDLKNIAMNNLYIKSIKTKKNGREYNSLSYLIKKNLSQSECIKLGIAIENILKDIILKENSFLINIKPKNKKGEKEKDHLFIDNKNKIIYYAELKANLNLDTEKSKSTINKCIEIEQNLQKNYEDYEIKMFLVGLRYYDKSIIPQNIKKKYKLIENNIIGINNYFIFLNVKYIFKDETDYTIFLNYIADLFVD